jgi:pyruvate dehydrogenase E1 component alpha subunit
VYIRVLLPPGAALIEYPQTYLSMARKASSAEAGVKAPRTRKSGNGDASRKGKSPADAERLAIERPEDLPGDADFRFYVDGGHTHEDLELSEEQLIAMYRDMMLQRRFEERAAQMYGRQKIAGFLHLYIGQEAVSTGTVFACKDDDPIITAYRDHGLGLSRGMTANECMAELFGKIGGSSRGKGGSMHFFKAEKHFYGGHGIVGGQIPLGVGLAFACKYQGTENVAVTFFGDGALNQGSFHEAMNLAALYDLPVLFVCENNRYGMGTSIERSTAEPELYKQAYGYGMIGAVVDGMDLFTVYKAMKELADESRKTNRPVLIDMRTYRYRGHSMSDPAKYRTKEELEAKKNEDPIVRLKAYMLERKISDNKTLDAIDEDVKEEVNASVEFAENSPFPPVETMYEDVYVQEDYPFLA